MDMAPSGGVAAHAPPIADAALELALDPDDLHHLARFPGLARTGLARTASLVWYDTPDGVLAAQDLVLAKDGRGWRLERLRPGPAAEWPPASPPPVVDAGPAPATLQPHPPLDAAPIAAFDGRRRRYRAQGAELSLLYGTLRGVTAERRVCRLALQGPAASLPHLAHDLAATLRLSVPRGSLAVEGTAVARAADMPGRRSGVPKVSRHTSVSDGLTQIIGHLLDTLLHWTDRCTDARAAEPVHQARVSTRRLRSALSIYKRAAPCPELEALAPALKDCAARLGAVRDWDVFLDGAGARLAAATGEDKRITTLLRMARRRRAEAYAELRRFLASPAFRELEIGLACAASLRPWEAVAGADALQGETATFATSVLDRRLKRVRRVGRDLDALPVPALHELRKDCKRLRYAAEFFIVSFPGAAGKRFLRRLADLQEELGLLNDAAAATGLVAQLGRAGRGYAGGVVEGATVLAADAARARIGQAWKRFRGTPRFWDG